MNLGVWIGIIGGILGLAVGIGAVLATTGSMGIYIAGGMLLIFGGMFFLFYKLFFGPLINANRLQKNGVAGKALIKEVHDTGVTINNAPQVRLVLEIKNYLGQTYTTSIRTLVSRLNPGMYQTGMIVPVRIDPKNDNNVIIYWDNDSSNSSQKQNAASSGGMSIAGSLEKNIMQQQETDDAIRSAGSRARAIVKNYNWLGVYLNGHNPYVELQVEVLPDGATAFSATVKGVIQESSVPRYQPGQEIFIKYNPLDNTKVAMDHS